MEKILLAINPTKINTNTIDFACYLADLTKSKLTAVLLEVPVEHTGAVVQLVDRDQYPDNGSQNEQQSATVKLTKEEQPTQLFRNMCKNRGIDCDIHHDKRVPIEELVAESRFADLLVMDAEMSFINKPEIVPTNFVKETLAKAECPVVIAPNRFYGIDEIVLAYDGKASSVFAIKQFTYLLPEMSYKKVTILHVNDNGGLMRCDNRKIREFLQMHYGGVQFEFLKGKPSDQLVRYLVSKKNVFVVMGAFGRSMFSNFFNHSTAELLIKTVSVPLFIAHY